MNIRYVYVLSLENMIAGNQQNIQSESNEAKELCDGDVC